MAIILEMKLAHNFYIPFVVTVMNSHSSSKVCFWGIEHSKSNHRWHYILCLSYSDRLIVHSDDSDPYLDTLELLEVEIQKFRPQALVVGRLYQINN